MLDASACVTLKPFKSVINPKCPLESTINKSCLKYNCFTNAVKPFPIQINELHMLYGMKNAECWKLCVCWEVPELGVSNFLAQFKC